MSEGPREAGSRLDEQQVKELLSDTERVRRVARAQRRVVAVPLFVLGALLLVYAVLSVIDLSRMMALEPGDETFDPGLTRFLETYWATVGAVGLVAIGVWFRRRSQRTGAGPGGLAWIVAGAVLLLLVSGGGGLLPLGGLFFVAGFLAPTLFIVIPLLVIAAQRRSARLAAWVVTFGVVTILAGLGFFTNRLADLVHLTGLESGVPAGLIVGADEAVLVLLALVLLVAAERTRRSEARRSS